MSKQVHSALDMFGGTQVKFDDLVKENATRQQHNANAINRLG